jgi:hypothetical protein
MNQLKMYKNLNKSENNKIKFTQVFNLILS